MENKNENQINENNSETLENTDNMFDENTAVLKSIYSQDDEQNRKKSRKIFGIILIIILAISLAVVGYIIYDRNNATEEKESGVNVSLKDDFYESINYETLKNAKIPSDSGVWSKAYDATKAIEKITNELTDEILEDPNYKNENIDAILELYTDYEGRNKRGISELQPYLDMVDNAKTIEEFNDVLMTLNEDLGVNPLISYAATTDLYDSKKTVLMFEQITLSGNVFEVFTNSKYSTYVPYIEKLMKKIFEVIGYSEEKTSESIKQIEEFAKLIQSKSINRGEVRDNFEIYNKYTFDEINNEIKKLPIKRLLSELKVDKEEFYIVTDMNHYKAVDDYYTVDNLGVIKEFTKLTIISAYLEFTTEDNIKFILDFNNQLQGTSISMEEFEEDRLYSFKQYYILDEIEKRYEAKYFTADDKKKVADLVEEVKAYYEEVIKNCDWLSESTKEEALKKLSQMKVKIGYQESEENDDDEYELVPKSKGGTLISNVIGENRFNFKNFYKNFEKEASETIFSTLEVNAFYDPQNNSINFLAGFKELYANETDYYKLLGYFGFVIGHEISHAFDSTGSKFDENGKVRDWWTAEDKENYEILTKKIEEYYSKYEYMGYKVDGKKTLPENIADLAAMKAMISIAESKGATNDDYKKLFEAYADLWAEKSNKEYAEYLSINDTHSPSKIRVNAVLSSTDKFYEVYDIKETDKMYVPKEERVGLW